MGNEGPILRVTKKRLHEDAAKIDEAGREIRACAGELSNHLDIELALTPYAQRLLETIGDHGNDLDKLADEMRTRYDTQS